MDCGHDFLSLVDVPPDAAHPEWTVACGACIEEAFDRYAKEGPR